MQLLQGIILLNGDIFYSVFTMVKNLFYNFNFAVPQNHEKLGRKVL